MRHLPLLLLLFVCLYLSACVPVMRTLRPKLHGTVTDFVSKEPLADVILAGGSDGAETRSDALGHFSLSGSYTLGYNMLGGEGYPLSYRALFRKPGYLPFEDAHFGGWGTGQGMREHEVNPRMLRENHPIAVALTQAKAQTLDEQPLSKKETEAACLRLLTAVRQAGLERADAAYLLTFYDSPYARSLFGESDVFCRREVKEGTRIWP